MIGSNKQGNDISDNIVRAVLPRKLQKMREGRLSNMTVSADSVQELERGLRFVACFSACLFVSLSLGSLMMI